MNLVKLIAAWSGLALFCQGSALAQSATVDAKLAARLRAAEQWIGIQLAREAVPGASMAIVHDQRVLWSKGFGFANRARGVRATPQTRYSICSQSKLFTSMAAMRERDAGRLDLDRPISHYLGWYQIRNAAGADSAVTARAIMSHVAGLPTDADLPYWQELNFPDLAAVKARLRQQTNLSRPFSYLEYSNLGVTLLGELVAHTAGVPFDQYIRSNFLSPLGLSRTTTDLPVDLWGGELAVGYKPRRTGWLRTPFPKYKLNAIAPAAGFASTVEDMGKFASWQFRLLSNGGEEVLRSSTLREMQRVHWVTPDKPDQTWGLGFATFQHKGKSFVGHYGECPGYWTAFMMRPQDKLALIVMLNVDDVKPGKFARELWDFTSTEVFRMTAAENRQPSASQGQAKPKMDLSAFEGRYGAPDRTWDLYVIPYGEELHAISLFADSAFESLARFQHIEGDTFRRLRDDGTLAEELKFERRPDGRPFRLWRHSSYLVRM